VAEQVLSQRDGDVVTITLNQPDKRNALSLPVLRALTAAFVEVGRSDATGIILQANGPVFSAGHNFGDMFGADYAVTYEVFDTCTTMMNTIQAIPQVVLAKVHALATAAGCQLVATCDLAVAADTASFAIPGGKGGLFCHTPLVAVARNIGRKRALEMALTGDAVDAHTALQWGFVNAVVPAADLDNSAADLLARATRGSALSKGLGKQAFYRQIDMAQNDAYSYAVGMMAAAATTADAQEGIAAFLAKRHPHFGGTEAGVPT
jgi:enoyl-CoA hydratase/carnithine racemase